MSVYHKEKPEYFDLALKSNLVDQTLLPDEFVLVCDGKLTAELDKVIENYQSRFPDILKVYRFNENQGLGKALNFGIEKCSYELIARADSDDVCADTRFEEQIEYFKNNDIDFLGSYIYEFEQDYTNPDTIKELPLEHDDIVKMARMRNPLNHMTVMYKKSAVVDVGSYIHLPYTEDFYLWLRAINKGYKFANIGKVLVYARVGNGMVERRGNKEYISSWKVLAKYMLDNKMITRFKYIENMVSVRAFIYMPLRVREFFYKYVLRKKI